MADEIYSYLEECGLKHSNLGYKYVYESLRFIIGNHKGVWKITDIYEEVARRFNTNSWNVERAIRHSISGLHMSNKEFLARAQDQIRYGYKAGIYAEPEVNDTGQEYVDKVPIPLGKWL